jgi:hypothetical protein
MAPTASEKFGPISAVRELLGNRLMVSARVIALAVM